MKLELTLSREMWDDRSTEQKAALEARFDVKVAPSYAPAPDLDTPIELAMVPRFAEVAHG